MSVSTYNQRNLGVLELSVDFEIWERRQLLGLNLHPQDHEFQNRKRQQLQDVSEMFPPTQQEKSIRNIEELNKWIYFYIFRFNSKSQLEKEKK